MRNCKATRIRQKPTLQGTAPTGKSDIRLFNSPINSEPFQSRSENPAAPNKSTEQPRKHEMIRMTGWFAMSQL